MKFPCPSIYRVQWYSTVPGRPVDYRAPRGSNLTWYLAWYTKVQPFYSYVYYGIYGQVKVYSYEYTCCYLHQDLLSI